MANTKSTPRAPRGNATSIAKQAAAEKQRKADSRAALKAAKQTPSDESIKKIVEEDVAQRVADRAEQDRLNRLATAQQDAAATELPVEQILADMGCDAEGRILESNEKQRYSGPMLALVTARKAYLKAPNGNPCCADNLAALCGAYSRETVVTALIKALGLPSNPYLALNPGQQSMNLRNKARHALKSGTVQIADIDACLRATSALKA
jgi:hypothetical protein